MLYRLLVIVVAVLVYAAPAVAQGLPGIDSNKCLADKNKCVNKKIAGLLKCRQKCQKSPTKCGQAQTDCETKVMAKFDGGLNPAKGCFSKLETKADPAKPASVCTTTGDTSGMEAKVDAVVADVLAVLEGTAPLSICGNGIAEGDEQCDGVDLDGAGCGTLGYTGGGTLACDAGCGFDTSGCGSQSFPATGQVTCYDGDGNVVACPGTGQDGSVQAGGLLAHQDNGDGSITDLNTRLMWEKKSDDSTLNDVDNCYPWTGVCSGDGTTTCVRDAGCGGVGGTCDTGDCLTGFPNGLTIFEWVDALNAAAFAGHSDWRVPNIRELQSIVDYEEVSPAVSAAFNSDCTPNCTVLTCSCTRSSNYWSSTTFTNNPSGAWFVAGASGADANIDKFTNGYVRAVRGGS